MRQSSITILSFPDELLERIFKNLLPATLGEYRGVYPLYNFGVDNAGFRDSLVDDENNQGEEDKEDQEDQEDQEGKNYSNHLPVCRRVCRRFARIATPLLFRLFIVKWPNVSFHWMYEERDRFVRDTASLLLKHGPNIRMLAMLFRLPTSPAFVQYLGNFPAFRNLRILTWMGNYDLTASTNTFVSEFVLRLLTSAPALRLLSFEGAYDLDWSCIRGNFDNVRVLHLCHPPSWQFLLSTPCLEVLSLSASYISVDRLPFEVPLPWATLKELNIDCLTMSQLKTLFGGFTNFLDSTGCNMTPLTELTILGGDKSYEESSPLVNHVVNTFRRQPLRLLTLDIFWLCESYLQDIMDAFPSLEHLTLIDGCHSWSEPCWKDIEDLFLTELTLDRAPSLISLTWSSCGHYDVDECEPSVVIEHVGPLFASLCRTLPHFRKLVMCGTSTVVRYNESTPELDSDTENWVDPDDTHTSYHVTPFAITFQALLDNEGQYTGYSYDIGEKIPLQHATSAWWSRNWHSAVYS
ncbi:hypothetical protein BU17DRAFT_65797 [Hysterangium stoloniferum]|nr:hypothetical protein BU17DRAFT_65797 [Hysterangium stoloniferum]